MPVVTSVQLCEFPAPRGTGSCLEKQKEISGPATMISEFLLWGTFGLSNESLTLFPSF